MENLYVFFSTIKIRIHGMNLGERAKIAQILQAMIVSKEL